MTRIIVAGSREYKNYPYLIRMMNEYTLGIREFIILSGHAYGADQLAEKWCLEIAWMPIEVYHPEYEKYGRGAPFKRNEEMARAGDALVAFWNGESRGTWDMIQRAYKHDLPIKVVPF